MTGEEFGVNTLLAKQTKIGLWIATLLTALMGVVNLLSAVTPSLSDRTHWLREIVPFEIRASGHIFAALTGFILLTLAANLLRRKRVAWFLTIVVLVISIFSHLIKGWDYEECILAGVLLIQLLFMRRVFTAQSDRPSIAQGILVLIGALLFTTAYGTAGFFILDGKFEVDKQPINFNLMQAFLQTLAVFFTEDNAGLEAKTRFGSFFIDSIYVVGTATLGYALIMLLRPVLLRRSETEQDREKAETIVREYSLSPLARLSLLDDKFYYFSPSGKTVIAYVPKGRGAIALGDPIGPKEELAETILGFNKFCFLNDWYPAFYQTGSDNLEIYRLLGWRILQIGQAAIVDLKTFSTKGKANQNLRTAVNRFTKLGYEVKFYEPPISKELLDKLKPVSDEWLQMMKGAEKRFSVGWFNDKYLRNNAIAVIQNSSSDIAAFANLISANKSTEIAVDLMRRRADVENGVMEFLFVSLLQHYQQLGYERFDLGLSALSGIGEKQESPRLEKALRYLYLHLDHFYNFQGLHSFKEKFHPHWEPRYLIYPSLAALPDVIVGLVRADSGDRFLDYLQP
ncbi:phosphatidylglycerol lysyltransferase domain-containing protein [[Phormidium] sp. LEGE 05292]|uniref:phosphatidylglycerol lysyltransferase domain-containing protein n=1 Tax=[Phormidium] sp. LEGE 05292 TaxID=767427 RepID=UPI001D13E7AF|nr:phosphatidylglycerol lysyltransferase domain-containing protein [Phormidium sp. LEGE 05292]